MGAIPRAKVAVVTGVSQITRFQRKSHVSLTVQLQQYLVQISRSSALSIGVHIIHEIGLGLNALARIGAYIIDLSLPK